jgi:hypothetical protein
MIASAIGAGQAKNCRLIGKVNFIDQTLNTTPPLLLFDSGSEAYVSAAACLSFCIATHQVRHHPQDHRHHRITASPKWRRSGLPLDASTDLVVHTPLTHFEWCPHGHGRTRMNRSARAPFTSTAEMEVMVKVVSPDLQIEFPFFQSQ